MKVVEDDRVRVPVGTARAGAVTISVRPQVINVLVGDEQPSYSFDRLGRLFGAFVAGRNYRRGLDNRVLEKWREGGARQRRWLTAEEARAFLAAAYGVAGEAARAAGTPGVDALRQWDWAALEEDAARFRRVYKPVSILPPDQYLALVLQATEGCSYNRCTFCDFYRDRAFRIKGREEFQAHVKAVKEFFGPAISLRRSIFLADANALIAPMPRVRDWFAVVDRLFEESGLRPGRGAYSFIDAFDVARKTEDEWRELAARGLRRVYIGLESGDDELLRFLRKPGCAGDAVEAVARLKAARIHASVIVMTGVGGDRYAERHVAATAGALAAMPLAEGDIIYFSPFVDRAGSEYGSLAAAAGIRPVDEAAAASQEVALRGALRAACAGRWPGPGPQFAPYDIREFIY